ncbi:MAG TPA: lipopolysaccharide biosynthesis protein [Patescibacteria group bacterium]|nr:lipopolysaccharide biosynthesis protein [Patescibacteria group bacterium]
MRRVVFFSFVWKFTERISTQLIQFIVQVVLARILMPSDYGIVSVVTILISFASVFVQAGFNSALVQKKDSDVIDFSSVFILNIILATFMYVVIFFIAPFAADFYEQPMLVAVLRVASISLFFGALNSVQIAVISKNLEFKKSFYSYLVAVLISGSIGIYMAYKGFGVWALVVYQLLNSAVICIVMWLIVKWRPQIVFSYKRLRGLFSYGCKIFAANLIDTIYKEVQYVILGKIATAEMLGYYSRGLQFPTLFVRNINETLKMVLLPVYSSEQENSLKVKAMLRISVRCIVFLVFPTMVGMAVVANPMVALILTNKWLPSVPFIQIFCVSYALSSLMAANGQAINSLGRSDIYFSIIIKKVVFMVTSMAISSQFGIYAVAISTIFTDLFGILLTFTPNKKLLNYNCKEMLNDILPSLLLSVAMGILVYFVSMLNMTLIVELFAQVIFGVVIYIVMAWLLKMKELTFIIQVIKELRTRH